MFKTLKCATALALIFAGTTATAETTLTVSTWAGPNHNMNATVFPRIAEMLKECSGGDINVKIEFGLAPPPAQYDTVRDGVADLTWIVHGYTPGKFVTTKLAELVPAPAVYETIASGVAEGVFFPAETLFAFKTAELTKYSYVNPDGMYTTSFGLLMNSDSYDGLSDANRKCVDDMRGVEMARWIGKVWDEADAFGLEKATADNGLQTIEMDAAQRAYFTEKTAGIEAAVIAEVDGAGVNGAEALAYLKSQIK